jgi:uncharacterized surface protein with fasciclin (FAS1) repeats
MPIAGILAARSAVRAIVSVAVLLSVSPPACHATHNITAILSGYRDLSEFSRALTATGLADDIDGRNTITVLAVNDAHMAPLLKARRGLPREAQRRVLSLHVLADYYDAAKLRRLPGGSVDASTLFQASGDAPGSAGMVKISDRRGGRVAFAPQDAPASTVLYVKSVHETPYDISVLQVSGVILSSAAEAPVSPRHNINVSDVLSRNGCGRFAGLVTATGDAAATYDASVREGFTVFCPEDEAVEAFKPTFARLAADARRAVVLYHGMLGHYSSKALEANREDLFTLAPSGDESYYDCAERHVDGTVTLVSASHNAARVTRLLVDADPLAVYMIDAVLLPYNLSAAPPGLGLSDATNASAGGKDGHQKNGANASSVLALAPMCGFAAYALSVLLMAFAA